MDSLSTKRYFRNKNVTQKEQPIQSLQFATSLKITLSHWLFFPGYVQYLELRLVLKLSSTESWLSSFCRCDGPCHVTPTWSATWFLLNSVPSPFCSTHHQPQGWKLHLGGAPHWPNPGSEAPIHVVLDVASGGSRFIPTCLIRFLLNQKSLSPQCLSAHLIQNSVQFKRMRDLVLAFRIKREEPVWVGPG